jgi:hypothetical protein
MKKTTPLKNALLKMKEDKPKCTLSHAGLSFPVSIAAIIHPMLSSESCCFRISVGSHPDSIN